MKATMIAVTMALVLAGAVAPAVAQETPPSPPSAVQELRQQFVQERAEVLSKILEKRAELVRLSAQKDPDIARVQELVREIAELRNEQQKRCAEYRATVGVLRQPDLEPLGRPRAGRIGLGPGAGYGRGRPQVGPWRGLGRLREPAGRPGPARSWSGRGPRRGQGPGLGRGRGLTPPFERGAARGAFRGPGGGRQRRPDAPPCGPGPFFVDRDNDGVCDSWQGWGGPPAPPVEPPAEETGTSVEAK